MTLDSGKRRFLFECKHHKDPQPWAALKQAWAGVRKLTDCPVAIVKKTRQKPEIWMDAKAARVWKIDTDNAELRKKRGNRRSWLEIRRAYVWSLEDFERVLEVYQ